MLVQYTCSKLANIIWRPTYNSEPCSDIVITCKIHTSFMLYNNRAIYTSYTFTLHTYAICSQQLYFLSHCILNRKHANDRLDELQLLPSHLHGPFPPTNIICQVLGLQL